MIETTDDLNHRAPLTVCDQLIEKVKEGGDWVAFCRFDGLGLTFRDWHLRSNALANGLIRRGLRRAELVGLLFDNRNWIDFAISYIAVQKAGGVAVPLFAELTHSEVARHLDSLDIERVLTYETHPGASAKWATLSRDLEADDVDLPNLPIQPLDIAEVTLTSGTSGLPKGVAASHANLTYRFKDFSPGDSPEQAYLHAFPIGTNAAQGALMFPLHPKVRITEFVCDRFEPHTFLEAIERFEISQISLVAPMARALVSYPDAVRFDLSSVKAITLGGAFTAPATLEALTHLFSGALVVNTYTSTEASPSSLAMAYDSDRPQSLGKPMRNGAVRIIDASGAVVRRNEVGEVALKVPGHARAYYADSLSTKEVFVDGWVRMGDLGYIDVDGYLYLVDRKTDVINVGGLKVSTLEVEGTLLEHPAIRDAAVLSLPHQVLGEMVVAAVVATETLSEDEVFEFLAGKLAHYKIPRAVAFLDEMPIRLSGKVDQKALRSRWQKSDTSTEPTNQLERDILELWLFVLGLRSGGTDDDFVECGGHSISAADLAARIYHLTGVQISALDILRARTVQRVARFVSKRSRPDRRR